MKSIRPRDILAFSLALIVTCSVVAAPSTTVCPKILVERNQNLSVVLTDNLKSSSEVNEDEFAKWPYSIWQKRNGENLTFIYSHIFTGFKTYGDGKSRLTQQVLMLSNFPKTQRKLIQLMMKREMAREYRQRNAKSVYDEQLKQLTELIIRARKGGYDSGISDSYIRESAIEDGSEALANGVEIGAIVFTLRDGTNTAIFTSNKSRQILSQDLSAAISGIVKKVQGRYLTRVQFFHTHPGPGVSPLSNADIQCTNDIRDAFYKSLGIVVETHIYAISGTSAEPVIFHYGTILRP